MPHALINRLFKICFDHHTLNKQPLSSNMCHFLKSARPSWTLRHHLPPFGSLLCLNPYTHILILWLLNALWTQRHRPTKPPDSPNKNKAIQTLRLPCIAMLIRRVNLAIYTHQRAIWPHTPYTPLGQHSWWLHETPCLVRHYGEWRMSLAEPVYLRWC